jgi:hypothetical protein
MTIQPHELKLAAKLLEIASDYFANHGCNDFDLVEAGLTPEQAYEVNRAFVEYQGDADDWTEEELRVTHACCGDSGLMEWLADKLQKESKSLTSEEE